MLKRFIIEIIKAETCNCFAVPCIKNMLRLMDMYWFFITEPKNKLINVCP
jgi:hypothetical protein